MSRPSSNATHADCHPVGRAGDGTKTGDEASFDWGALVPPLVHPLKVAIIEALVWIRVPLSASDLEKVLDGRVGLSNISYHVRELARVGAIEQDRMRHVRGALEKFYRLSDQMLAPSSARPGDA